MVKKYLIGLLFGFILLGSACGDKKQKAEVQRSVEMNDSVESLVPRDTFINKDGERIIFKGGGTEPFWGIEITEKIIQYTSLVEGFEKFVVPVTDPIRAADTNVKIYAAETESVTVRIQILHRDCTDAMSGKIYGYTVRVEIKRGVDDDFTTFEGCGNYITDYRLNDIWVLEEMEGKVVKKEDFQKGLPNMEIHTTENTFMGHAGCNRMNGKIFSEGNVLRFLDIATTRMMCRPENQEELFLRNLKASVQFKIQNNRLHLNNPDGPTLVFRKID